MLDKVLEKYFIQTLGLQYMKEDSKKELLSLILHDFPIDTWDEEMKVYMKQFFDSLIMIKESNFT